MDAKLKVKLDVKLGINTKCKQWHTKCFKLEVKNCAIVDTKKGTKHGMQKDIKLGKNKDT